MANTATNEVLIIFKEDQNLEQRKQVINYMEEHLICDEIYNDVKDEDLEDNFLNISYGTKWSERIEILQEVCNIFDVHIVGVCYEWGCLYVNAFELYKETKEDE